MIVIEQEELEKLGVEKKIIKRIRKDFSEESPDVEVDQNTKAISQLVDALSAAVNKPAEKGVDLSPIVDAIYNVQESQLTVLQLLEKKIETQKAKKFEFTVIRNAQGSIHKITATELIK